MMLKKFFPMIDTNHDGAIDAAELAAAQKPMLRRGGGPKTPAVATSGRQGRPSGGRRDLHTERTLDLRRTYGRYP